MNLAEVLQFRRAVRVFDKRKPLDSDKVKACLELAMLAPTSSNMQLWEAYHVTDEKLKSRLAVACMSQSSCKTASDIIVFVTRQDLYRQRCQYLLERESDNIRKNSPAEKVEKRIKDVHNYYGKLMPFLYARCFRMVGLVRKLIVNSVGLFRPAVYEVSESDMKAGVHKSCALAVQTFMIAMANEGYDTCPLEGFDSRKIKQILHLPAGAKINMVLPCGVRDPLNGARGDRVRVPFNEVYHRL